MILSTTELPLAALLERARLAAVDAGLELSRRFGRAVQTRMKGEDDPVTEADLAAAAVLRQRLLSDPVGEWLCEEAPDIPQSPVYWAVDPMDGTRSFLNGEPDFTVAVGLVAHGQVLLGVVHNPITGEMYTAMRGGGLRVEGREARGSQGSGTPHLADCRLIASRTELKRGQLGGLESAVGEVVPCGSIAYKMARVAAGDGDATISRTPKSLWDFAAAALFLEEAGLKVTDLYDVPLDGRAKQRLGVVAAPAALHRELLDWLKAHGLDRTI